MARDEQGLKKALVEIDELQKKFYEVSEKIYQAQAQQNPQDAGAQGQQGGADNGDPYVDADYKDVD